MAKDFKLLDALKAGLVAGYKLEGDDNYLITVMGKSRQIIIPCLKTKTEKGVNTRAYIGDRPDDEYNMLSELVSQIGKFKVFEGMFEYTPRPEEAPEHSHVIERQLKASAAATSSKAKEVLEKAGYTFVETAGIETTLVRKTYDKLLAIPEVKEMFDKDAEDLASVGATYSELSDEIKIAFESVMNGKSAGIIFTGPTGTGKTFASRILAHEAKSPLLNLQITYGTTIEDLVGMFIPNAEASKEVIEQVNEIYHSKDTLQNILDRIGEVINKPSEQGKWKFVPGKLLIAYNKGYQISLEEINYGQPGVNAKLNEFTDGTPRINVNGITYTRDPNFVVYMTMNPGYEGTECLNVALKNRFAIVNVPELTKEQFCKRIMAYGKKTYGHLLKKAFFDKLYDFGLLIEKEAKSSKWRENIKFSIRNAQRLCDCILTKSVNLDEFSSAMAIQYVNCLNCDNDNSSKLEAYKKSEALVGKIKELYELYDFAIIKTVEVTKDLEDFFKDVEDPTPTSGKSGSASDKTKTIEGILGRFSSSGEESK